MYNLINLYLKEYSNIDNQTSLTWYKSLDTNTKINVKECFILLTGVSFSNLSFLFSYSERIDILYNKLKLEGFINN